MSVSCGTRKVASLRLFDLAGGPEVCVSGAGARRTQTRSGVSQTPSASGIMMRRVWCHDVGVRTTITLDDDLAAALKELSRRRQTPFRQVVNEVLRAGLAPRERAVAYRMSPGWLPELPADLGIGGDLRRADGEVDMNRLADALEGTELVRKLQQGR